MAKFNLKVTIMWKRMLFKTHSCNNLKKVCLKSNNDERIQNLGILHTTENPNCVFFLSIFVFGHIYKGEMRKCVSNDVIFHTMMNFKWNVAINFRGKFGALEGHQDSNKISGKIVLICNDIDLLILHTDGWDVIEKELYLKLKLRLN